MSVRDSDRGVSRRDFLKLAGVAGVTVGAGAGLGGILAACGGEETTSTTAAAASTTASTGGATTTTAQAGTTTSASTSAETGREVKLGFVVPQTGPYSLAAVPDRYIVKRWQEFVGDGVVLGDGKKHAIKFEVADSQSSSSRAGEVAGGLINDAKIDMMMGAAGPDNVIPVADQAEAFGIPCVTDDAPWEAYWNSRGAPAEGFKWTYHWHFGQRDTQRVYFDIWSQFPNNKVYGALWPNDADGNAYRKSWPGAIEKNGWKLSDPGAFEPGLEDYGAVIATFKKDGADIVAGVVTAPDFTNFFKQALQQGYHPKQITIAKSCQDYQTIESLGDIALYLTTAIYWHPRFPFKSSLTGETCQQFADAYEADTGEQWQPRIYHYSVFEVALHALKQVPDLDDKAAIVKAVSTAKLDTLSGPIDFSAPVDINGRHPVPNVCVTPIGAGQWVKGEKHPYDQKITSTLGSPELVKEGDTVPLALEGAS